MVPVLVALIALFGVWWSSNRTLKGLSDQRKYESTEESRLYILRLTRELCLKVESIRREALSILDKRRFEPSALLAETEGGPLDGWLSDADSFKGLQANVESLVDEASLLDLQPLTEELGFMVEEFNRYARYLEHLHSDPSRYEDDVRAIRRKLGERLRGRTVETLRASLKPIPA